MKVMLPAFALALVMFASCDKDDDNNSNKTVSSADSAFSPMAAMSNYAEVSAGQLALTRSSDSSVLAFANRMIADHTKAQDSLKLVASQYGLRAPDSLNYEQAAVAAQLQTLTGRAFDSAYIFSELDGHVKTIALLNDEKVNGTNSALKQYVDTYLPAVQMHYDMADSLSNNF